mmetsp:Transcript_5240/g.22274  ORF Transcript_5240/g.22274 Transcript_5240/m.22274 type:complete len:336 (+) Transcript_5240:805-1812(+)
MLERHGICDAVRRRSVHSEGGNRKAFCQEVRHEPSRARRSSSRRCRSQRAARCGDDDRAHEPQGVKHAQEGQRIRGRPHTEPARGGCSAEAGAVGRGCSGAESGGSDSQTQQQGANGLPGSKTSPQLCGRQRWCASKHADFNAATAPLGPAFSNTSPRCGSRNLGCNVCVGGFGFRAPGQGGGCRRSERNAHFRCASSAAQVLVGEHRLSSIATGLKRAIHGRCHVVTRLGPDAALCASNGRSVEGFGCWPANKQPSGCRRCEPVRRPHQARPEGALRHKRTPVLAEAATGGTHGAQSHPGSAREAGHEAGPCAVTLQRRGAMPQAASSCGRRCC